MKSKKNSLLIFLAVLIVVRLVVMFIEYRKTQVHDTPDTDTSSVSIVSDKTIEEDANLAKIPHEAATSQNSTLKTAVCQTMRTKYQKLEDVKKFEKTSLRFENIHKKVDGIIYRLRFFYKDSSENEIPTYLLYKEEQKEGQDEEEHLIEKSPYKKGAKYQKIVKAAGTVIYTEQGVNVGAEQNLFLHYKNGQLLDLQGVSNDADKDFIECRF